MKQGILLLMALGFFALHSRAQIAYKDGDMFVIECVGMPAAAYTKTPKPRTTDGTNGSTGSNTAANLGSQINREKVVYKFEVAATDNPTNLSWLEAVNLCAGLPGGNWRLPILRELALICIMEEVLNSLSGFTPFQKNIYWSATEYLGAANGVDMNLAFNEQGVSKNAAHHFRCIRDF